MITIQHVEEGLSKAYVLAVGCRAGMLCNVDFSFDYGIDGTYREVEYRPDSRRKYFDSGFSLDFQLKASKNIEVVDNNIIYDIDSDTYNELIQSNRGTPCILIVMKLPNDDTTWLDINEEESILRNCAWYVSLEGKKKTENKKKIRIKIPKKQILTPNALINLMEMVKEGELK